jgi:hypothetical protein
MRIVSLPYLDELAAGGGLWQRLVVGTGGHVVGMRRLLFRRRSG